MGTEQACIPLRIESYISQRAFPDVRLVLLVCPTALHEGFGRLRCSCRPLGFAHEHCKGIACLGILSAYTNTSDQGKMAFFEVTNVH